MIEFSDNIHRQLDFWNYVISIFIDFTKAFDTVDHDILLQKLDRYGVRGHANHFIKLYLSNRKQYTVINGERSEVEDIIYGVPQGSVLVPLFFALYINDMYRSVGSDVVRLFADDNVLFLQGNDLIKLIADITVKFNNLYDWCISNKLPISSEKTQLMVFHTPDKPMPNNLSEIDTMRMKIKRVNIIKYLGVIFDEKLKWNNYIDYICDSLIKYYGIFNHLKHKATKLIARELYYAFIYSKIKCGIEVYGAASTTNMEKLQIMQNKLIKLILKLDMRTSTYYLHSTL